MTIVTWDTVNKGTGVTLSNGNLTAVIPNSNNAVRASTGKTSGKWYWEISFSALSNAHLGIVNSLYNLSAYAVTGANARVYYNGNGLKYPEGASYGAPYAGSDIIGVSLNVDDGTLEFYKNGVSQGVSHTNIKTMGEVYPFVTSGSSTVGNTNTANFGATQFAYPIPEGFRSYDNSQPVLSKILISLDDNEYIKWNDGSVNAVPIMTSNVSVGGTSRASSFHSSLYEPWKAFNGDVTTIYDGWQTAVGSQVGWLEYEFSSPQKIAKYSITSPDKTISDRAPKSWTFEGSNDNFFTFEILDAQVNQMAWDSYEKRDFSINNTSDYKSYRLNVTLNNGGVYTFVQEFQMFEAFTIKTVSTAFPTEQEFIDSGMEKSVLQFIPETAWREFEGMQISILEYTDNLNQTESVIETETEPYSIYDEFGDTMEVLYYTDDPTKSSASLDITANYSPLDELNGDFEVVTWTDELDASRTLKLTGLPKPQFITLVDPITILGDFSGILPVELLSQAEKGTVRYLISSDNKHWKTWNGITFTSVDTSSMSNIMSDGLSLEKINAISPIQWSSWSGNKLYIGIYLDEDIRDESKSQIDKISYSQLVAKNTTKVSDAKLYILNTKSTIDVEFQGSTVTGLISDEDAGKVQYRIKLNNQNYFPADGSFTPLMVSPLNISTTLSNKDILIDQNNTLRIEFQDYWGSMDYWETNFIGTYSGLLFLDETGRYYSTDIGEVLQYLDFGMIIAGQTTVEQAIILKNTYGYPVNNIRIRANQVEFPEGMSAQFGTSEMTFEALDELNLDIQLLDEEEIKFYLRIASQIGTPPKPNGEFDIIITADKAEEAI
jgi:hypothetical protein